MTQKIFHGWYNYELYGSTAFWLSEDGSTEVEVSFVEEDYDSKREGSYTYVGKVISFVRLGTQGKRPIPKESTFNTIGIKDFIDIKDFEEEFPRNNVFKLFPKPVFCHRIYNGGVGECTCGKCLIIIITDGSDKKNPFQYSEEDRQAWKTDQPKEEKVAHDESITTDGYHTIRECQYGQF